MIKLACFDIDRTLTKSELYLKIIADEKKEGLVKTSALEKIQQEVAKYKAGKISYETVTSRVVNLHAQGLAGQSIKEAARHAESFIQNAADEFLSYVQPAVDLLRKDFQLTIVTAEPEFLAQATQKFIGMHKVISSKFEIDNKKFTGKVATSLAKRDAKHDALSGKEVYFAFGDAEGDIDMLKQAHYAFCIQPTKGLQAAAKKYHWPMYEDNDLLLQHLKAL